MRPQLFGCAFALATTLASALNTQQSCGDHGICFQVNVPSDGNDLFFQITGPSSMSWISLGQGTKMMGANMFVVYSDSAGKNVTLSSRLGTGHSQPQDSLSTQATLLDGSIVTEDKIVANVKCSNCQSWTGGTMDFTSASTNWIYAYHSGSAIQSDSVSAQIAMHDGTGGFQFDLTKATGGDGTVNPFYPAGGNGSTSPNGNPSSISSNDDDPVISASATAHGLIAAIIFILVFPTGGIILRIVPFKNVFWIHVGLQMLGFIASLGVLETGVYLAVKHGGGFLNPHLILGLIVIGGLFIQPLLGLGHHILFKRQGGPNVLTIPHVWWGRIFITVGIINGGLGLQLSQQSMGMTIAYGVVASVVWSTWMGLNLLSFMRNRGQPKTEMKNKPVHGAGSNDNPAGMSHSSKI